MAGDSAEKLTQALKSEAHRLGFQLVGVCPCVEPPGLGRFYEWLGCAYDGEMSYLRRRRDAYADPTRVLDGVRSIVMLGMNYFGCAPSRLAEGMGRVSRYAWGSVDYHDLIHERLKQLERWITNACSRCKVRSVVDTAPLLEREFAQLAGLGWIGKNTMLINKQWGSWFFLASVLTDLELHYDAPSEIDHCGTCTACLDACPTHAFPQPGVLDARRCISYLTIEHRTTIDHSLRNDMGRWVFGCDICQDVCPWNRRTPSADEPQFQPREEMNPLDLLELFELDEAQFRARFRATPLWRARRRGLLRNAAIALGNHPSASSLRALALGLADKEPLVRESAAWALGRIRIEQALALLRERQPLEADPLVARQIAVSMEQLTRSDSRPSGKTPGEPIVRK